VQLSLVYEARANGLLCSTARARRAECRTMHDAERFSDRETPLHEYHPAFHLDPGSDDLEETDADQSTSAFEAADRAVDVFVRLGWPRETTRVGVDYVCDRLTRAGTRQSAYEALRRDEHALALLDLTQSSWLAMLKGLLGIQHQDREHTNAGRGMLMLFLIGHQVDDVVSMPDITTLLTRDVAALAVEDRDG